MTLDRRTFLTGTAVAALGSRWLRAAPSRQGLLMGPSAGVKVATGEKVFGWELIDLDLAGRRSISLDFFAHGFAQDPHSPRRAMIFEKKGPGGCEVDLQERNLVRKIPPAPGCAFYGHGTFTRDGSVFLATESRLDTKAGQITFRDAKTLKILGEFPTFGASPHDCTLVQGGKVLVITNGGGDLQSHERPCVTYVDVASHKLLDKAFPTNPRLNTGHLALSRKGDLVVISAPRDGLATTELGGISWRKGGNRKPTLSSLDRPREVVGLQPGETLSLCIHEASRTVGITSPAGNQLSFWNLDGMILKKFLTLSGARGIALTLDQSAFVVSHGPRPSLSFFDARSLEPMPMRSLEDVAISGSHLFVIPPPR